MRGALGAVGGGQKRIASADAGVRRKKKLLGEGGAEESEEGDFRGSTKEVFEGGTGLTGSRRRGQKKGKSAGTARRKRAKRPTEDCGYPAQCCGSKKCRTGLGVRTQAGWVSPGDRAWKGGAGPCIVRGFLQKGRFRILAEDGDELVDGTNFGTLETGKCEAHGGTTGIWGRSCALK